MKYKNKLASSGDVLRHAKQIFGFKVILSSLMFLINILSAELSSRIYIRRKKHKIFQEMPP